MNLYTSFYLDNSCLHSLKDYCQERICIYSDDDPFVPSKDALDFANAIEAEKILIENSGHFNELSGYKEFPELLKFI